MKLIFRLSIVLLLAGVALMFHSCNKSGFVTGEDDKEESGNGSAPVISFSFPEDELTLGLNQEYVLAPEIVSGETGDLKITWRINGKDVASGYEYTFVAETTGVYTVTVTAENSFGKDVKAFSIIVLESLPYSVSFPTPSYFIKTTERYTFAGRPVYLTPVVENLAGKSFEWTVNGSVSNCHEKTFRYCPDTPGEYNVSVTVDGKASATVKVVCVQEDEQSRFRPGISAADVAKVIEYCPAPGQFIADPLIGGMKTELKTLDEANRWAEERMAKGAFVSLGGFGGYIIVGFGHSVPRGSKEYDFIIEGNAFLNAQSADGGSNEPGIVYVMQDVNGNGIPDDEWYELRGSETDNPLMKYDYALTYYKPETVKTDVVWKDNEGLYGAIERNPFHTQDSYYPAWIPEGEYTLRGSCIPAQTSVDPESGFWNNNPYAWGYVDNMGSDNIKGGTTGQRNAFKISNAMYPTRETINLQYIDFIKVQTGVNSKSGALGEISTEVVSFSPAL